MKRLVFSITIPVICFLMLLACGNLYAGIGLDPIRIEAKAAFGEEVTGKWNVVNTGQEVINIDIECRDWLKKGIDPYSWVTIEPKEFTLMPEEVREVEFKINVPEGSSGEFMTMVFFNGRKGPGTVGISVGAPLYASVRGTEKVNAEITEFKIEYNAKPEISGWVEIENKGNVHIRPQTTIDVMDSKGNRVYSFNAPFGMAIQPGDKKRYDFVNEEFELKPGNYKVSLKSRFGMLFGIPKELNSEAKLKVKGKKDTRKRRRR